MGEDHVRLIVNHARQVDETFIPAGQVGDVRGQDFERLTGSEIPVDDVGCDFLLPVHADRMIRGESPLYVDDSEFFHDPLHFLTVHDDAPLPAQAVYDQA